MKNKQGSVCGVKSSPKELHIGRFRPYPFRCIFLLSQSAAFRVNSRRPALPFPLGENQGETRSLASHKPQVASCLAPLLTSTTDPGHWWLRKWVTAGQAVSESTGRLVKTQSSKPRHSDMVGYGKEPEDLQTRLSSPGDTEASQTDFHHILLLRDC